MQAHEIERYRTTFQIWHLECAIAGRQRLAEQVPDWRDWHLQYVAWYRADLRELQAKLDMLEQL